VDRIDTGESNTASALGQGFALSAITGILCHR